MCLDCDTWRWASWDRVAYVAMFLGWGGIPKVDASLMLPRYFPDASQIPDAQMPPRCFPDASQMPPRCFPDASQVLPRCFQDPKCPRDASHDIHIPSRWLLSLKLPQMASKCFSKRFCLGSRAGVIYYYYRLFVLFFCENMKSRR